MKNGFRIKNGKLNELYYSGIVVYCRDFGEGVKEGLGRKPFPPGVLCWWLFSPPLFMVVEVFQGTELKLRAWMTSWYEVLVWLCLAWCGCAGPSVVVWLWCVPSRLGFISGLGVG